MALFSPQPKERRKNRGGLTQGRLVIDHARMYRALVEISNKTQSQMDDKAFRKWAQDFAHSIVEDIRRAG